MSRFLSVLPVRLVSLVASSSSSKTSYSRVSICRFSDMNAVPDNKIIYIRNFDVAVDDQVLPSVSLATASQKEIVDYKKSIAVKTFQAHPTDTGSAPVQIAAMTENILNMARHSLLHKKDKAGLRGYQMMLSRRKKMMKYLKKTDLPLFKTTVQRLGLEKEASTIK